MIQNKLYELMKKYMGEFLFGFDKDQLEVAIFSGTLTPTLGSINLKDVNIKPGAINAKLTTVKAPISIKAGIIGKLEVKVSKHLTNSTISLVAFLILSV